MNQYNQLLAQIEALPGLPPAVADKLCWYARGIQDTTIKNTYPYYLAAQAAAVCEAFALVHLVHGGRAQALGLAFERFARDRMAWLVERPTCVAVAP